MGRFFVRCCAPVLACAVVLAFVGTPTAGAAAPAATHSPSFVGTYTFHVSGSTTVVIDVQVNADGSATAQATSGTWSNRRRNFTLTFTFATITEVFTAKQTTKGLASKAHPGSLVINGTPAGTWYALKTG